MTKCGKQKPDTNNKTLLHGGKTEKYPELYGNATGKEL